MMELQRFLARLGVTTPAAAISATRIVSTPSGDRLMTRYSFMPAGARGFPVRPNQQTVTALVLPAPEGQACRALIYPTAFPQVRGKGEGRWDDNVGSPLDPWAQADVVGFVSGSDPAEIVITGIDKADGTQRTLISADHPADAVIFNTLEFFAPLDIGRITNKVPLQIDYQTMWKTNGDTHLLLGIFWYGSEAR